MAVALSVWSGFSLWLDELASYLVKTLKSSRGVGCVLLLQLQASCLHLLALRRCWHVITTKVIPAENGVLSISVTYKGEKV